MHPVLWIGAGIGLGLALVSGYAEGRRARRRDPDAVGLVPWRSVQLLAIVAVLLCASLALNLPQ
jgi:hypothetical protein